MAKGINVVERGEKTVDNVQDKFYYVKGFEFLSVDEKTQEPFFPLRDNPFTGQKELRTNIKFVCVDPNEEGPAMGLTPPEFMGLVQAFGVTDFLPTKKNLTLSSVMLEAKKKVDATNKTIAVESKNGWVNGYDLRKSGVMHPPKGKHQVKFVGTYPEDGTFKPGRDDSEYIILKFEIAGDSPWEGYPVNLFMNNVFVDYLDDNGTIYNAIEDERPVMGFGPTNQKRWLAFGEYFANNLWKTYDWKVNPSESQYEICEVKQPQIVLADVAKKLGTPVTVWIEKREKSDAYWFELNDLEKYNTLNQDRTAEISEFIEYVKNYDWRFMNEQGQEDMIDPEQIFETETPLVFTDYGKTEWAKRFLATPWQSAGLNMDDRRFEILSPTDLGRLMDEMESLYA